MFLGAHRHTLDAKGRLIIPAKDRHLIGQGGVLTQGQEPCVSLYTREAFTQIYHRALEQSPTDLETRDLYRSIFSRAVGVELDTAGRISIPANLREFAALDKDVVLIGSGLYLEIWDVERWAAHESRMDELNADPNRFVTKDLAVGRRAE